jgi:hypothetical protein
MYCPQCGSEYRPGFTVCSDCQVPLVPDRPGQPPDASAAADGSFTLVWTGTDPQEHAAILEILERENIDARTIRGEDHPIFANTHPGFEVYVPAPLAARAAEALKDHDALLQVQEEQIDEAPVELPAEDDALLDDGRQRREADWHPEDATAEIWAGEDHELADMIAMCLRENHIACLNSTDLAEEASEADASDAPPDSSAMETAASPSVSPAMERLFVLPQDEARGKEIVREIINAKPL